MDQSIYLRILSEDPVLSIRIVLRFFHFVGLAIGLGSATLLDVMLLRFFVRKKISRESYDIVVFAATVINVGLFLLWFTGIGFIIHYSLFDPAKLANEKIWAKLAVVTILSLNGLFIHAVVLPRIRRQVNKALFEGVPTSQKSAFLVSGAISVTSWYVPVVLGAFPQLNFTVPATTLLLSYGILVGLAFLTMSVLMRLIEPDFGRRPQQWRGSDAVD